MGGSEAARPSLMTCSRLGVRRPRSGEKGCVGEISGGPRAGETRMAELALLETQMGEGSRSGCVGMMPSAASN
eukprot:4272389-Alexandrium_andersonii.AAC.1